MNQLSNDSFPGQLLVMGTKILLKRHTKSEFRPCAQSALIARAEFGPVVTSRVKAGVSWRPGRRFRPAKGGARERDTGR